MNVLIALDSFKGSLSAREACRIVARTLEKRMPSCRPAILPLADGGEGTAETLVAGYGGRMLRFPGITGPLLGMNVEAALGWLETRATAVIEMAQASGLTLLAQNQRNPLLATTLGTGELLRNAMGLGARKILLTLGGSATVDGGTGAARALGWRFLDRHGNDLPHGGGPLVDLHAIIPPAKRPVVRMTVLCDVTNPLCGPRGAAVVYGPQKGATPETVDLLDRALSRLAEVINRDLGLSIGALPGAGAAGGFGAGAVAFLGGVLQPGMEAVARLVDLEDALRRSDWVVTGEGRFDEQSLCGKVVDGVCKAVRGRNTRVAVVAGSVTLPEQAWKDAGIALVESCAPHGMSPAEAIRRARPLLSAAAARLARRLTDE